MSFPGEPMFADLTEYNGARMISGISRTNNLTSGLSTDAYTSLFTLHDMQTSPYWPDDYHKDGGGTFDIRESAVCITTATAWIEIPSSSTTMTGAASLYRYPPYVNINIEWGISSSAIYQTSEPRFALQWPKSYDKQSPTQLWTNEEPVWVLPSRHSMSATNPNAGSLASVNTRCIAKFFTPSGSWSSRISGTAYGVVMWNGIVFHKYT